MGDKNKNLISLGDRPPEERAAICSAGGKAASENRARRKAFREELIDALAIIDDEKLGKTAQSVGIAAIMQRYKRGDLKAFELIRDTVGEKPIDKVMVADVDIGVIEQIEKMVLGKDNDA